MKGFIAVGVPSVRGKAATPTVGDDRESLMDQLLAIDDDIRGVFWRERGSATIPEEGDGRESLMDQLVAEEEFSGVFCKERERGSAAMPTEGEGRESLPDQLVEEEAMRGVPCRESESGRAATPERALEGVVGRWSLTERNLDRPSRWQWHFSNLYITQLFHLILVRQICLLNKFPYQV